MMHDDSESHCVFYYRYHIVWVNQVPLQGTHRCTEALDAGYLLPGLSEERR